MASWYWFLAVAISFTIFAFSVVACDERKRAAEDAAQLADAVKKAGGTPPVLPARPLIVCDNVTIRWFLILAPVVMALGVYLAENRHA